MAEHDDSDYEGDLQPLLQELEALRRALGDSYVAVADLGLEEAPQPAAPSPAPVPTPAPAPAPRKEPAPLPERLAAVAAALEANRSLQARLRRLVASIERAQDQVVVVRNRAADVQRRRATAAAAPRAPAARRVAEPSTGVSWFWAQPAAPPPPAYPGAADLRAVTAEVPLIFSRQRWNDAERDALRAGVLQVVQERQLNEILGELEAGDDDTDVADRLEALQARQAPIRALTIDAPEVIATAAELTDAEWDTVARRCVSAHTGVECKLQWANAARPGLVLGPFTPDEDEELLTLVERHGDRSWGAVAAELRGGGVRTPLACMSRHQQLQHARRGAQEFTPADLERLAEIVGRVGVAWRRVAEEFGGPWDADQLMHHWRRAAQRREASAAAPSSATAGPSTAPPRTGKWSREEDDLLLTAVALYGRKWSRVATMVPGRSDVQCRERFVNCLDPEINNTGAWSLDEDAALREAVEQHTAADGKIKWAAVARGIPGRTDNLCMKRWKILLKGPPPQAKKPPKPKKAGRKNEKPAESVAASVAVAVEEAPKVTRGGRGVKRPSRFDE